MDLTGISTSEQKRAQEVDELLIGCIHEHDRLREQAIHLLMEMEDRQFYRALGFPSIDEYLWDRWGKRRRWYFHQKALYRARKQIPQFNEAVERGDINQALARDIATVITEDNAKDLLEVVSGKKYREGYQALQDVTAKREYKAVRGIALGGEKLEFRTIKVIVTEEVFRFWAHVLTVAEKIAGQGASHSKILETVLDAAASEIQVSYPDAWEEFPPQGRKRGVGSDPGTGLS